MSQNFDPTLLPVVLLVWPAAKALVFMGAAAVNLWSREPSRRAEARRLLRMMTGGGGDDRSGDEK